MHAEGFDVLTWRKVPAENVDEGEFTDLTYRDEGTRCRRHVVTPQSGGRGAADKERSGSDQEGERVDEL
jgi:hypothetical protein